MKKLILPILVILILTPLTAQQKVSVTGVDSSGILKNGLVHLYVSLSDGLSLENLPEKNAFSLEELNTVTGTWNKKEIQDMQYNGFKQDEISLLLLIDNSGSMYDDLSGKKTEKQENQRIYFLIKALQELFTSTRDYKDYLSLYTFNTNVDRISAFTSNRNQLLNSLTEISRPKPDQSYTELYRALKIGADEISKKSGRKVIILLSDGENYTYSENKKEPHPLWGNNLVDLSEIEKIFQLRGITLYTIQYARETGQDLDKISKLTGGNSYPASSRDDLLKAYREIHDRINKEFKISYKPEVSSSRQRMVRITVAGQGRSPEFPYILEMFWGLSPVLPWWIYSILTVLSILIVLLIHRTPFEKIYSFPHLEVLASFESQKTIIQISQEKTMIAVGREQTMVMDEKEFLNKNDEETGITIVKSDDGTFHLEADHEIQINNRTVISRELEPGDVIRSEGTLIIFDVPEEKK